MMGEGVDLVEVSIIMYTLQCGLKNDNSINDNSINIL